MNHDIQNRLQTKKRPRNRQDPKIALWKFRHGYQQMTSLCPIFGGPLFRSETGRDLVGKTHLMILSYTFPIPLLNIFPVGTGLWCNHFNMVHSLTILPFWNVFQTFPNTIQSTPSRNPKDSNRYIINVPEPREGHWWKQRDVDGFGMLVYISISLLL